MSPLGYRSQWCSFGVRRSLLSACVLIIYLSCSGLDRELEHVVGVGRGMEGTRSEHLWFTIRQTQDNRGTGVHTRNNLQTVQAPGALKVKWVMGV